MILMLPLPFRKSIFRDQIKGPKISRDLNYLPEVNSDNISSPGYVQNTNVRIYSCNAIGYHSKDELNLAQ